MIWILLIMCTGIIVLVFFFRWKKNGLKIEVTRYGTPILKSEITSNTMELVLSNNNSKVNIKSTKIKDQKELYEDLV